MVGRRGLVRRLGCGRVGAVPDRWRGGRDRTGLLLLGGGGQQSSREFFERPPSVDGLKHFPKKYLPPANGITQAGWYLQP